MTIETLKSPNPRNRNSISVINSRFLSVSSMNTLLVILKVTDARHDVILAGGLCQRFPWRHLSPPTPGTADTGIWLLAVFKLELEMDYPSETGLCTVAPSPTDASPIFFLREGAAVHRLSETDNPSSNCPSKLTDKVRRIVHSKLKPFPFQIKTYYLSGANYHTNNPSLVWKRPFIL